MAKKIKESSWLIGEQGVQFLQEHCEANKIPFTKATKEEDIKLGVDVYMNNIPTDVKNTADFFFLQVYKDTNIINVRHPFKTNTQATHLARVKCYNNVNEFVEHIAIDTFLMRDYIKEGKLKQFFQVLAKMDGKHITSFYNSVSVKQFCWKLKEDFFTNYLKADANILYPDVDIVDYEVSLRLIKESYKRPQIIELSKSLTDRIQDKKDNPSVSTTISKFNSPIVIKI